MSKINRINYSELAAFYDRLQTADYAKIGSYYHRLLPENGILLDLACGTGTLSRYFADLDYDVIGVDISTEMLSEAMKNPHKKVQYLCQDMTELDLFGTIDCCICVLDGINHLPGKKAVKEAFSRVSLFMNKGGVFVFDVNTLYKHEEILSGNTFIYELEGLYCVWENSACDNGRINMTLNMFSQNNKNRENWERHTENLSETAYNLSEITQMLEETGFGDIKIYDWLSEKPVHKMSEKAVYIAICQK
jgi:SAM-dependent methyltransferase